MIRIIAAVALLALVLPAPVQAQAPKAPAVPAAIADPQNTILIDTKHGRITIKLRPDLAPQHVERIKLLTREGFYDDVPFHRVISNFMAQTGDGQLKNGLGGSKYPNLRSEFTSTPFKRGIVGMGRTPDPNSANSQFFIVLGEASHLNNNYTVIGEVVSGMDVVDKIKKAPPNDRSGAVVDPDVMTKATVAADAPR